MLPNIHFLGIQGSGKGTQTSFLAKEFGLTLIASGKMFRERALIDDQEGRRVKSYLEKGDLLPDQDLYQVVEELLDAAPAAKGVLGDGVLRTVTEYEMLLPLWERHGIDQPLIFHLDLSDDIAFDRIKQRQLHEERSDASEDAISRRISLFHQETKPVIDHAEERGRLITIDASQSIEAVSQQLLIHTKNYLHELA